MGTARNGDVELAFDVEGDGPNLLLIAGTASERALWSLARPALAQSWRTIAFDNRDSGRSSIVSEPYAFHDLVADAAAVLDGVGAQTAHVVGHSMGGVVAQELALALPARCRSLTLVCSWARTDRYARNCIELMGALARGVRDDRTLLASLLWVGAGAATLRQANIWEKTDAAMALGALAPREALVRQWELSLGTDTLERLPRLRLPAHVIWCSDDRLLPQPLSQELLQAIPGAVESRIDACGHLPMVDRPDAFCEAVNRFLSSVPT
ncbi:MAG TPA: alpha/beta hydrolase [Candidatus Cybelea sp.]|nr:alpha/beta hydrolase [Candidatus Cybelea sp.]